jgi:hypothetical protein
LRLLLSAGRFQKGSNRNTPATHEEMPIGIGVLFRDDLDGL